MKDEKASIVRNAAEHAHALAERAIGAMYVVVKETPDLFPEAAALEEEDVLFEALVAVLLHGLIVACKDRGIDFEQNLSDARQFEADAVEAYKMLARSRD